MSSTTSSRSGAEFDSSRVVRVGLGRRLSSCSWSVPMRFAPSHASLCPRRAAELVGSSLTQASATQYVNQTQLAQQADDGGDSDRDTENEADGQPGNDRANRRINIPLRPLMCAFCLSVCLSLSLSRARSLARSLPRALSRALSRLAPHFSLSNSFSHSALITPCGTGRPNQAGSLQSLAHIAARSLNGAQFRLTVGATAAGSEGQQR